MPCHSRFSITVLLTFLLTSLTECRDFFQTPRDGFLTLRDDTPVAYDPSEDPPPCFTLCGAASFDTVSGNGKRSLSLEDSIADLTLTVLEERTLDAILPEGNSTEYGSIVGRTLPGLTGNSVDNYMIGITSNEDVPAGTATHYFVWSDDDGGVWNTAMWQPFSTTPFNMVTRRIHGCTVICVWSRKGAWCGHFWQPLTFSKAKGFITPDINRQLLNQITGTGTSYVQGPTLASLADQFTINDNDADDQKNQVFAYIMSPRRYVTGQQGQFQYPKRIPQIKAAIAQVIPALSVDDIVAYDYVPVDAPIDDEAEDEPTELESTARGRVAFQFDPDADGQGSKGTRLIFERGELANVNLKEDKWTVNPS